MIAPAIAPPRPPIAPPSKPPATPPKMPPATGSCAAASWSGMAQASASMEPAVNMRSMDCPSLVSRADGN